MEQYISKSTLVAELNRLIAELVEEGENTMFEQGRISAFEDVKVFINHTLEVKEVDSTNALIEKACEYLEPILTEYAGFYVGGDILQYFRKAMEE